MSAIKDIPALLIFGDLDGTIKMGWLARLERIFPRHRSIMMQGSHHFSKIYSFATPKPVLISHQWTGFSESTNYR